MKLFVSTPFEGKSENEVRTCLAETEQLLKKKWGEKVEVVHNYDFTPENDRCNFGMACIAEAIKKMSECDAIVMRGDDWQCSRGCTIEYNVAIEYELMVIVLN